MKKEITDNTIVDMPRLEKLIEYLKLTDHLPGHNAEVGVYKGGTAYLISQHSTKPAHFFDTFEGMPDVDPIDIHKRGDFSDTSLKHVTELLKDFPHISIYKGKFPEQNSQVIEKRIFSFVHLDCDIYKSVKESLAFFYPRMAKGGVIVLDDYAEPNCPGARQATHEFLKRTGEKIHHACQSQAAIVIGENDD